jgi:restriction system protein
LSYFLLHAIASSPLPVAKTPQDIGQLATSDIWRGLAYAGQYVFPFFCGMGALASAIRRRGRQTLIDSMARSDSADALDGMSWREFELLVGEGFRQQGYAVSETGGAGPGSSIDLVLAKVGKKLLVQCKPRKAFKVGVTVIHELYGVWPRVAWRVVSSLHRGDLLRKPRLSQVVATSA